MNHDRLIFFLLGWCLAIAATTLAHLAADRYGPQDGPLLAALERRRLWVIERAWTAMPALEARVWLREAWMLSRVMDIVRGGRGKAATDVLIV